MVIRLFILLLIGFVWNESGFCFRKGQTAAPPLASRQLEILEGVFKYQIERCYNNLGPTVYFLSYQKADPPSELMERFNQFGIRVRRFSEKPQFHKARTGEAGVLLAIQSIEPDNNMAVRVRGSCNLGGLEGTSYIYRVVKKSGRWKVRSQRRTGFS